MSNLKWLLLFIVSSLISCGYAPHKDPELKLVENPMTAAVIAAIDGEGEASLITCCGSMEPLISNGDWVIVKKVEFTNDLLGKVGAYKPTWSSNVVAHRFVSGNAKDGFIASGDNNPRSEPHEPIRADKFKGEVVTIYRRPR
jgi:signal peptidase I